MLAAFLVENRQELISRCQAKVIGRREPADVSAVRSSGVPIFLEQLVEALRAEKVSPTPVNAKSDPTPAPTDIGRSAALHGVELLRRGYSVDQVVHDYGDVCQAVTSLAVERHVSIGTAEFRTLNRCLDNAIADAVASFGAENQVVQNRDAATLQQRLVAFSDEQRRLVEIAIQAFSAIKTGNVGMAGATGTLLVHALDELRSLTKRVLPEIGIPAPGVNDPPPPSLRLPPSSLTARPVRVETHTPVRRT